MNQKSSQRQKEKLWKTSLEKKKLLHSGWVRSKHSTCYSTQDAGDLCPDTRTQLSTCVWAEPLADMTSFLPLLFFTENSSTDQWEWLWSFCLGGTSCFVKLYMRDCKHHWVRYVSAAHSLQTHSLLQYSRCLALSRPFQFSQRDIPKIRKRIYKELCDCKLHIQDWWGVCCCQWRRVLLLIRVWKVQSQMSLSCIVSSSTTTLQHCAYSSTKCVCGSPLWYLVHCSE